MILRGGIFILDARNTFEIFFEKQLLFANCLLDEVEKYLGDYGDSNIYMVLLGDKLKIDRVQFFNGILLVSYSNLFTKMRYDLPGMVLFPFYIPDEMVVCTVIDGGLYLEISLTDNGMDYVKLADPINKSDYLKSLKIPVYELVSKFNESVKTTNYELLYIGKSYSENKKRTIFDRLKKHEAIQKISRNKSRVLEQKELMIFMHKATTKHFSVSSSPGSTVVLGNSRWDETSSIGKEIDESHMVTVAEALLINHFKPEYNTEYKNVDPHFGQKAYGALKNAHVKNVEVGINLFLADSKNKIQLHTRNTKTLTKQRNISCTLDDLINCDREVMITIEDMSDDLYHLFIEL